MDAGAYDLDHPHMCMSVAANGAIRRLIDDANGSLTLRDLFQAYLLTRTE